MTHRSGRGVGADRQQLGINQETLRNWVVRAEIDGGQRAGTTSDEAARIAAVERETVSCAATSHLSWAASQFRKVLDGRGLDS